jgi:hypothetical protein
MKNILQRFVRNDLWSFILFWVFTTVLYVPAWRSGFERDFHGWLEMYYYLGFWDCINSKTNDIHSLYQLTQLQLYFWTKLFGTNLICWFLLQTFLQAVVGICLIKWLRPFLQDMKVTKAETVAWFAAILFLSAPSNAEVVLWKAAYHYLVALIIILSVLRLEQLYLNTGHRKWALWTGILFFLATFTLELYYVLLPITVVLILVYYAAGNIDRKRRNQSLLLIFLPMCLLMGLHLLTYHLAYGGWLPHIQDLSEEAIGSPAHTFGRIVPYEFHFWALGRYFSFEHRQIVYKAFASVAAGWISLIVCLLLGIVLIVRFKKSSGAWKAVTFLFMASGAAMALILPFGLPDIFIYWNDRYLYLTSVFQVSLFVILVASVLKYRKAAFAIILGLTVIWSGFSFYVSIQCRRAAKVFWGIQENFKWKNETRPILLLNVPNNLDGAAIMYASWQTDIVNSHLQIFTGDSTHTRIVTLAGYNMVHWWDGAHATIIDSTHLKVTMDQWGSWWWNGTLGATDFENDLCKVHFIDGHDYEVELKQPLSHFLILTNRGPDWEIVH